MTTKARLLEATVDLLALLEEYEEMLERVVEYFEARDPDPDGERLAREISALLRQDAG